MRSSGINGGELTGQLANPGSPGKMAIKMECVCVCFHLQFCIELVTLFLQLYLQVLQVCKSNPCLCRAVMGEIKSQFDSIAIWIATKIRFKHCAIRFKYHATWYWFDSNFNDSIQETRDLNRNLEVMVEIEYSFSLLTTQSDRIFKCLVLPITDVCPQ